MELAISFLTACLFTVAISFGYGRKLTELDAGRPVLGAVGFLIVIAGYAWSRQDFGLFTELTMWFIVCCFPVLLAGVIRTMLDHERRETQRELEHNSVTLLRSIDD